jgi:hypothetical protein
VTGVQIIQKVESAGGVLTLKGDKITYDVPRTACALMDAVRVHRAEVLQALRQRQETAKQEVYRWIVARCTQSRRAWCAEKFLHRDYLGWCQRNGQAPCSRELFGTILDQSFHREADGWQGLCLAEDFAASKGVGQHSVMRLH